MTRLPFFCFRHSQCMYTCTWMPKSGGITSPSLVHTMCNGWSPVLTAHVTTILSPSFLFSKEKASITGGSRKRNMLKFSTVYEKIKRFIQTQLCIVEAWRALFHFLYNNKSIFMSRTDITQSTVLQKQKLLNRHQSKIKCRHKKDMYLEVVDD